MALLRWLNKNLELAFSSLLLVLMVLCVMLQVIGRYVMKVPNPWTEEAARYLFVWMVFASIGICARRGKHIRITIMHSILPRRITPFIDIFSDLCFGVIGWVFLKEGCALVLAMQNSGQVASSMEWFPIWALYAIVPVGFAMLLFRLAQDIVANVLHIMRHEDGGPAIEEDN